MIRLFFHFNFLFLVGRPKTKQQFCQTIFIFSPSKLDSRHTAHGSDEMNNFLVAEIDRNECHPRISDERWNTEKNKMAIRKSILLLLIFKKVSPLVHSAFHLFLITTHWSLPRNDFPHLPAICINLLGEARKWRRHASIHYYISAEHTETLMTFFFFPFVVLQKLHLQTVLHCLGDEDMNNSIESLWPADISIERRPRPMRKRQPRSNTW